MLRLTFFLASLLGGVNLYLADDIVLQILSGTLSVFSIGISIIWPEPLPPPRHQICGLMHLRKKNGK